ncbi:MAG: ankyrin repeat domain-containing protein [Acholeplasmatales bacterium]|nr:ankyrin repeat domain-containing protein [Acholeplasmatales bacterium]
MNAFDAIYSNNIQALRDYLSTGDVNVKNERGMSLLHYAISFGNVDVFDLLLENYIDINIKDSKGETPAHYCVINNKLAFLKTLIRKGCDLKLQNDDGQSPLFKACALGREEMVYLLLESQDFNLYDRDSKDETIFMALIRSRNIELLNKIEIDSGIVDVKNFAGEAPLHIAAKAGDVRVMSYLLENKAFVNAKNNQGETPLFYAVRQMNKEAIDLLLRYGACLDCRSTFGETIYELVPSYELLNYINEKSEQYKSFKYYSTYPLHYAIIIENYPKVMKFKDSKNIEKVDDFGYTPLDLAIRVGNERILRAIKEK